MAIDTIAGRLAALEVFRSFSPELIDRIAREADRIIYRDGQHLAKAGEEADAAILMVQGRARLLADEALGIAERSLAAGTMIAEIAMVTEHTMMSSIVADGDVRAIKIGREAMHALMGEHREVAEAFEARLTAKLSRLALEMRLIDERLAIAAAPESPKLSAA